MFSLLSRLISRGKIDALPFVRHLSERRGCVSSAQDMFRELGRHDCFADFWEDILACEDQSVLKSFTLLGKEYVRLRQMPFVIIPARKGRSAGIRCRICGVTSHRSDHVANRFCERCCLFLDHFGR